MGELRSRRPPAPVPPQALGRLGTVVAGPASLSDRGRHGDEESQREEHSKLRSSVAALRRENADVRDRLRLAEKDSYRKDKLLQELLATAKPGNGVPGEALDQLREDLQALLQFKKKAHEARLKLEEKEQKVVAVQQELRVTSVVDMEDDVASAKMEAKAKATEWSEASFGDKDTHCYAMSMRNQRTANGLLQRITDAENDISRNQRKVVTMQDERKRLEQSVKDQSQQIEKLQSKRTEIEAQIEQCQERLQNFAGMAQERDDLRTECEHLQQELNAARRESIARDVMSGMPGSGVRSVGFVGGVGDRDWEVSEQLFQPGFRPLRSAEDSGSGCSNRDVQMLLWRCRRALEAGRHSGIDVLASEDIDRDSRLSSSDFARVLHRLGVPGADEATISRMTEALDPSIADGQSISIVDFVLALPLQPPLEPPKDLSEALKALVWIFRRRSVSERDFRSRVSGWIADPGLDLESEAEQYCTSVGLNESLARVVGRGLDTLREGFVKELPSWRCMSRRGRATVLARFLGDIAARRDVVMPFLTVETVSLTNFLQIGAHLGAHWSRQNLEEVALAAEWRTATSGPLQTGAASEPPTVAAARLARAASKGGFRDEFPQEAADCLVDALTAVDNAAASPPKRVPIPTAVMPSAVAAIFASAKTAARPPVVAGPVPPPPPPLSASPAAAVATVPPPALALESPSPASAGSAHSAALAPPPAPIPPESRSPTPIITAVPAVAVSPSASAAGSAGEASPSSAVVATSSPVAAATRSAEAVTALPSPEAGPTEIVSTAVAEDQDAGTAEEEEEEDANEKRSYAEDDFDEDEFDDEEFDEDDDEDEED